jgi:hypothetical protein
MPSRKICETDETGETGENCCCYCAVLLLASTRRSAEFQFCSIESRYPASEQIEVLTGLTGLTGLPHFPLSFQGEDIEVGPNKLTTTPTVDTKRGPGSKPRPDPFAPLRLQSEDNSLAASDSRQTLCGGRAARCAIIAISPAATRATSAPAPLSCHTGA